MLYVGLVVNIFCVGTYYTYVNVQFVGKKIINEFNEELYLSQLHTNIVLKKKKDIIKYLCIAHTCCSFSYYTSHMWWYRDLTQVHYVQNRNCGRENTSGMEIDSKINYVSVYNAYVTHTCMGAYVLNACVTYKYWPCMIVRFSLWRSDLFIFVRIWV